MRVLAGGAAVLVLVFAAGCGGGGGAAPSAGGDNGTIAPGGAATPTPGGPAAATTCNDGAASGGTVISMEGVHSLNPSDVTLKAGDYLTFTNNSSTNHQITFTGGPDCAFSLVGKSVNIQFNTPGTYTYVCRIHPTYMKGTVTVQ